MSDEKKSGTEAEVSTSRDPRPSQAVIDAWSQAIEGFEDHAELRKRFREELLVLSAKQHKELAKITNKKLAQIEREVAAALLAAEGNEQSTTPVATPADQLAAPIPAVPPPFGEALVGLFCRREMREAVLGDLDEKFTELAERRGVSVAKAWYWSQAGRSALFFAVRWGRRLLELEAILKRIL